MRVCQVLSIKVFGYNLARTGREGPRAFEMPHHSTMFDGMLHNKSPNESQPKHFHLQGSGRVCT